MDPWLAGTNGWNWNWATVLAEVGVLALLPACVGWRRAGRPFSEKLDDWCAEDRILLTRESARLLRQALAGNTVTEWAASGVEKSLPHLSPTALGVWYCPRSGADRPADTEVYMTVGSASGVLLAPEEAAGLAELVPSLADLAVPPEAKFETAAKSAASTDPAAARLLQVPGSFVGLAQKRAVIWKGRALMYGLMFAPLLVMAAFAGVLFLLHLLNVPDDWFTVFFVIGVLSLLVGMRGWFNGEMDVPFVRLVKYYRGVVTRQAAARPDPLFTPEDPRVIYTEVYPRRVWTDMTGRRHEAEAGLLLIDTASATLLYEGDRHRYVVPVASIVRCDLEEMSITGNVGGFFAVVLVVRHAGGTHELPLSPLDGIEGRNR